MPTDLAIDPRDSPAISRRTTSSREILVLFPNIRVWHGGRRYALISRTCFNDMSGANRAAESFANS
jgi:hypothetical protein